MHDTYYLLDDMEKYFPDFKREKYEDIGKDDLIEISRDYYKCHLPVDVTAWIRVNEPDEHLIYKEGLGHQVCFLRDTIMRGLFYENCHGEYETNAYEDFQPRVIGTHRSKSVLLPVMEIVLEKYDIIITARYNFYDWCISISSIKNIDLDHKGLITDEDVFFEGFPLCKVYGKYETDKSKFSFCLRNDYEFYTFMYLLRDYLINH